jgi:hypothetical protein
VLVRFAATIPLRRVRAGEVRSEEFLYELKAGLRAAACDGRPRAGSDTTVTMDPASPSSCGCS